MGMRPFRSWCRFPQCFSTSRCPPLPTHNMCRTLSHKSFDRLHKHKFFTFDSLHFAQENYYIVWHKEADCCEATFSHANLMLTFIVSEKKNWKNLNLTRAISGTELDCKNCVWVDTGTKFDAIRFDHANQNNRIKCKYFHTRFSFD